MTDFIFQFGNDLIALRYENRKLMFCKLQGGFYKVAPIEGLKLSIAGIIKEFPDLEDKPLSEMRKVAIARFKEKIEAMENEEGIKNYLKSDLKKHGYKLILTKKKGFRAKKEKND